MINKLIVDGLNIKLSESDALPFTYTFSTSGVHHVKIGLDDTTEICAYAFKDCEELTKVTFPSKINMIKRNAFENCISLKKITIPSTIEYVGPSVFDGCISLSEITFEAETPPTFYTNLSDDVICYIPDGSKFIEVSDYSQLVKDGSVQYYSKNLLGGYEEVDYEGLEEGEVYYYDNWTDVHEHYNVLEDRYRIPATDIAFYDGDAKVVDYPTVGDGQEYDLFEYKISPDNSTNSNVYWFSTNPALVSVDQQGHIETTIGIAGRATIYVCTEPDYTGSYVSTYLNVRVTNQSGVSRADSGIVMPASIEISNLDSQFTIDVTNPNGIGIAWQMDESDGIAISSATNTQVIVTPSEYGVYTLHGSTEETRIDNVIYNAKAFTCQIVVRETSDSIVAEYEGTGEQQIVNDGD